MPTHRDLEIPFVAVVNIRGDRLYHEHITWDQGTVLMQLGFMPGCLSTLKDPHDDTRDQHQQETCKTPVFGKETAAKLRDKNAVVSNALFDNLVSWKETK